MKYPVSLLDGQFTEQPNPDVTAIDFGVGLADPAYVEGRVYYDNANKALSAYSDIANTSLQIGQEELIRVVNKTGSTLTDGSVVYISGAQGNRPTADLADADNVTADMVIGVVTADIADNAEGYVTISGVVRGYDTSGFTEGDALYVSQTVGQLTNVAPVSPAHASLVGFALNSTVNGSILVSVHVGSDVGALHDVLITGLADGDVLRYETGTGLWKNVTVASLAGSVTHSSLAGLTTSDAGHTQFALLAGRSGGQTLYGGTAASENLTLASTADATKGKLLFGTSAYDEVNNRLGIGTASPSYAISVGNPLSGMATVTPKIFSLGGPVIVQPGAVNSGLGVVTNDFATGVGTYLFIGLGATIGNTYGTIQGLVNGVSNTGNVAINPLGGNVGIGTSSPTEKLDLGGNSMLTTQANITEWRFTSTGINAKNLVVSGGWARSLLTYTNSAGTAYFGIGGRGTGQTFTYGWIGLAFDDYSLAWTNLLVDIGSTTSNRNLNVYGNGLVTGNLTVDTNTLYVDATNNRVGVGTTSPSYQFHQSQAVVQPTAAFAGIATTPTVTLTGASSVSKQGVLADIVVNMNGNADAGLRGGAFIARTGGGSGGTLNQLIGNLAWTVHNNSGTVTDSIAYFAIGPSNTGGGVITNAYGFRIGQIGAGTNNYALFTEVTANTNKWEIYANGGAQNYFKGNVGIGVTVPTDTLHVAGHMYGDLSHAENYENNNTGSLISLTTAGTFYGWVTATEGANSGASYADFTDNATADRITIGSLGAGKYLVNIAVSFEGTAATTFTWSVHKNGSPVTNLEFDRTMGTASQTGSGSMVGIVTAAAGDYFDLRVTADGNSKTVTVYHVALTMVRIAR